jgi:drug/metabolite transporter (DMT)-like permease
MYIVFIMYALFASVFTAGKFTLGYASPYFLTGTRMLLAGSILIIYLLIRKPSKLYVKKEHWPLLILIGIFNVFLTNGLEFWALQYMDTGKTCLIYSLSPFVSIILSYIFLSETMNGRKWIGLIIGLLGFIPIFTTSGSSSETINSLLIFSTAELAVTISAITAVIGWILVKKLTKTYKYPFITTNAISFFIGGAISLIVSLIIEPYHPLPITNMEYFIIGLIYTSVIPNVICYNLYAYSLQRFSVTFMTFAGISGPVFTAILGWMFLNEKVGWQFFLSLAIVFIGLLTFSKGELSMSKIRINNKCKRR